MTPAPDYEAVLRLRGGTRRYSWKNLRVSMRATDDLTAAREAMRLVSLEVSRWSEVTCDVSCGNRAVGVCESRFRLRDHRRHVTWAIPDPTHVVVLRGQDGIVDAANVTSLDISAASDSEALDRAGRMMLSWRAHHDWRGVRCVVSRDDEVLGEWRCRHHSRAGWKDSWEPAVAVHESVEAVAPAP